MYNVLAAVAVGVALNVNLKVIMLESSRVSGSIRARFSSSKALQLLPSFRRRLVELSGAEGAAMLPVSPCRDGAARLASHC